MQEIILELIEEKKFSKLRSMLDNMNPADIALILEEAEDKDLPVVFRILPKELAAEVFSYMESDMQQFLIEKFSDTELKTVLDELFMDDTVDIIEEMPANIAKRILKQTDPQTRKKINQLLAYPEDSAGSIMTTEYIDLKKNMPEADVKVYLEQPAAIFSELKGFEEIVTDFPEEEPFDVYFALDCNEERLGEAAKYFGAAKKKVNTMAYTLSIWQKMQK